MKTFDLLASVALASTAAAQAVYYTNSSYTNSSSGVNLRIDNGTYGPMVEEVHYYYDQWPIGLAVSSTGRIFTCYTRGDYEYTLGVVVNMTAEKAFGTNLGPTQLNTTFNGIDFGVSNTTALINVQALYITPSTANRPETLWALDTGRPTIHNSQGDPSMPYAQPGGPKLVGYNITGGNDTVYETFTFPATVHYPDSYMNDIRFDLRMNTSGTAGKGIVYIVDSSDEGRNGFIMLDLGTGESWRRLTQDPSVLRVNNNVPSYVARPFYYRRKGMPISTLREGLDGIQITSDGERIYYSPLTSTYLYSIPSVNLRARDSDPLAELAAHSNISSHGQRGADANGFEGDTNGLIYQLMPTENGVYYYDPKDLQTHGYWSDPRALWLDSCSIGDDGYLYANVNQLYYQPDWNDGIDYREKPGVILRTKLPNGGSKIHLP